jgi:putative transcriptional regulator
MAPAILIASLLMSDLKQPEFSQLIQELRRRVGLTQTELAERIGVSYYSVNRWENQKTMPVALALKRVEEILHEMGDRGADLLEQYFPVEGRE